MPPVAELRRRAGVADAKYNEADLVPDALVPDTWDIHQDRNQRYQETYSGEQRDRDQRMIV
jgi:hypothetical protein